MLLVLLFEVFDQVSELLLLGSESGWLQILNILEVVIYLDKGTFCIPALVDVLFLNDIDFTIKRDLLLSLEEDSAHRFLLVGLGFRSRSEESLSQQM